MWIIFLPVVAVLSISLFLASMASSSSTSHRNTENKSSSSITPPNAYNSRSAFTLSWDRPFKRLTSFFCGAVSGTHNSHPVHHDQLPPTTIIDINSHELSSSVPLTINSNDSQENNQLTVNSNPTNNSQENNQTVLISSSVPLSVNSNPTNDSQENNQSVLLRTQSLSRIELGPAFPDKAVVGLRIYANNIQLVVHYHVTNTQMIAPNTGKSLGKTFLGLTYQAAIGFVIFHYQSLSSSSSSSSSHIGAPSVPLHIVGVTTVVGFAASLIGILLRKPYPMLASLVEKFGSVSAALGFFVMMGVFLPRISQWIEWVAGIGCLIAFVFAFLKVR